MICPHCLVGFHETWQWSQKFVSDTEGQWQTSWVVCPECKRVTIQLRLSDGGNVTKRISMIHPKGISRAPLSADVPEEFAADYREACVVLADSPKASAALSRRCLQHVLREVGKFKAHNLDTEIQKAIDSKTLPTYITDALDAVRAVGNFGAHPIKSTSSGEIIDVEPGEAEQQLDTLEVLFDFYFVAPAVAAKKKAAINAKLAEAGKPLLK